ncbi:MAG: NifU family protein [Labilithrix sp.]|nr:NifU family protein [Labilithrix sp.]
MTAHAPSPATVESESDLESLVRDIARLEGVVEAWPDEQQRLAVTALKNAVERLHREALRRMIRSVKVSPGGLAALKEAAADPIVLSVLEYHELLRAPRPSIEDRVRTALAEVRPSLEAHQGDVSLAQVRGDVVEVTLHGTCVNCPSSTITLTDGIEEAIKRHCPEIRSVVAVSSPAEERSNLVQLKSPFGKKRWARAALVSDVPDGDVLGVSVEGRAVLLSRKGGSVRAYRNACAHLGMPLDDGSIDGDVLTCDYHGFQYLLATGECLTAPEVQLQGFAVRIEAGAVLVRIDD